MTEDRLIRAVISDDGRFRYRLSRQLGRGTRSVAFIMLNPSTADARNDDPTVRRCVNYAAAWGFDRLHVLNLFAYRATSPHDLRRELLDPPPPVMRHMMDSRELQFEREYESWPYHMRVVGKDNRYWWERTLSQCGLVVCAWGNHGDLAGQDRKALSWLHYEHYRPRALTITKKGQPGHPLRLPSDLRPDWMHDFNTHPHYEFKWEKNKWEE